MRVLRILFFFVAVSLFYSCDKDEIFECWVFQDGAFVFTEITRPPEYINGGEEGLFEDAGKEIKYPPEARENGIEGQVVAQYEITEIGEVENIEIVTDIGGGCGVEVKRVLGLVTTGISFKPAIIESASVRVRKELPIIFKLE